MSNKKILLGETTEDWHYEETGDRDAFHMPCILAYCHDNDLHVKGCGLGPGDSVRFVGDPADGEVESCSKSERHGIVDPFIEETDLKGKAFWVFLSPGLVQNLTHNFKLSIEDDDEDEEDSECTMMGCT